MVRLASTAPPMTVPVVPLIPLGRSTANTGSPAPLIASMAVRASPATGRSSPAPSSASTMTWAPVRSGTPGGIEAVAAIIAGPGHDGDFAAGRMPRHHGGGHRRAGILHQGLAGDAGRDGMAIRLAHFHIGEKLEHQSRIPIPAPQRMQVCGQKLCIASLMIHHIWHQATATMACLHVYKSLCIHINQCWSSGPAAIAPRTY